MLGGMHQWPSFHSIVKMNRFVGRKPSFRHSPEPVSPLSSAIVNLCAVPILEKDSRQAFKSVMNDWLIPVFLVGQTRSMRGERLPDMQRGLIWRRGRPEGPLLADAKGRREVKGAPPLPLSPLPSCAQLKAQIVPKLRGRKSS